MPTCYYVLFISYSMMHFFYLPMVPEINTIPFHSIPFYSIIFYSILFYSIRAYTLFRYPNICNVIL